jgi:hypothetical protein
VNVGTISKRVLLEKSKLAQHAYEEANRVGWEIESISSYGK